MRFNQIQFTSDTALNCEFALTAPICVLCGRHADLALDLMRELIGDYGSTDDPDRVADGRFVLHSNIEMDDKIYNLCYIRNADFMGDHRIAANFQPNNIEFSVDDTNEFMCKCERRNIDDRNIFDKNKILTEPSLSESDLFIASFNAFLKQLPDNDDRPLFIYDLFDRIDESIDIAPYLNALSKSGRQVFISSCSNFDQKKFKYSYVKRIDLTRCFPEILASLNEGDVYDEDFTVIKCPVCKCHTLDNHWICSNCGWEYDSLPEDRFSAANRSTLTEYRKKYYENLEK